jgi:hypothetical protein
LFEKRSRVSHSMTPSNFQTVADGERYGSDLLGILREVASAI